jgi:hypothetical protein
MASELYPCPCCGHLVFEEPVGSYAICPICFWEDDPVQLRFVDFRGGANRPNLIEAQREYEACGAMERRFLPNVRPPHANDRRDAGWRHAGPGDIEPNGPDIPFTPYPAERGALYYWRPSYWRRR